MLSGIFEGKNTYLNLNDLINWVHNNNLLGVWIL